MFKNICHTLVDRESQQRTVWLRRSLVLLGAGLTALSSLEAQQLGVASQNTEVFDDVPTAGGFIHEGIEYEFLPVQPNCGKITASAVAEPQLEGESGVDDVLVALGVIDGSQERIRETSLDPNSYNLSEDFKIRTNTQTCNKRRLYGYSVLDRRRDLYKELVYTPVGDFWCKTSYLDSKDEITALQNQFGPSGFLTYANVTRESRHFDLVTTRLLRYDSKTKKFGLSEEVQVPFYIQLVDHNHKLATERCRMSHGNPDLRTFAYDSSSRDVGFTKMICGASSSRKSLGEIIEQDPQKLCKIDNLSRSFPHALDVKVSTVREHDLKGQVPANRLACNPSVNEALVISGTIKINPNPCN